MEENEKLPDAMPESIEETESTAGPEASSAPGESLPGFEPIAVGKKEPEIKPAEVYIPEEALAPEKSRGGRFINAIRKGLIWLLVFAFIYLAGVVTIYILEFQPAKDALEQTQLELDQANQEIADLQLELDQAYIDLGYSVYLQVTTDVYAARLALLAEDTSSAKIYLANAEENLALILEDIAAFDQALADSISQRLSLVVTNIDSDIEQAIQDAAVISSDLDKVYDGVYATD